MISTKYYLYNAEQEIANFISDKYNPPPSEIEIIQVWYCKTIQNHKGLFIVKDILNGGTILPYFIEVTYNGDNGEMYLDFYTKEHKQIIRID